ncbi:NADP-dependent oxidoreductase [Agrobacterium tumefaciens]|uniref:NADP-dependent oxidoreductase n=1 Tax=Agrobacterium tumefaciens TaxID=358 RepID=UPI0021D01B78|nr:NADP-dependent oxidoreductase [Agrobacterium tumefaciens]
MGMKMQAVVIAEYGSNDVVEFTEVDRPEPQAGEVLVKVLAAGVNPVDWKIRNGAGQRMGMTLPIHLGGELVGTIKKIGSGVDGFSKGETVFGMVHTGAFAHYAVIKVGNMVRVPVGLDPVEAAALPLAGTTAWQALFDVADLKAGQRLLITNSSGGVGSLAVQFAKASGAHVTAVGSARNEDFVRSLGADVFVNYTSQPFEEVISDMDVVFDTMGGETFGRAFKTLRKGGFMVTVVAFPDGSEAERFGVSVKRSFTVPSAQSLTSIVELVEAGKVTPHVHNVLPLAEVRQALALSESGRARGKIVLSVSDLKGKYPIC